MEILSFSLGIPELTVEEWSPFETINYVGNTAIVQTDFMLALLEDVKTASFDKKNNHKIMVGPTKVGKTTILLWLYVRLKAMKANVRVVSYENLSYKLSDLTSLLNDAQFVLFDLHKFERQDPNRIFKLFSVCRTKVLVFASSGHVYITSASGTSHVLDRLSKMEQHTVPSLSQMDSEILCSLHYADITKDQIEYIISESGGLPGIITIRDKVSKFKSALYVHNSREWKKILIQLKSESITVHKHVRLFFAIVHGYSISYVDLEEEFVTASLPYLSHLITLDENGIPVPHIRNSLSVIQDLIHMIGFTDELASDADSAIGNVYEFMVLQAFEECTISSINLLVKNSTCSTCSFNLAVGRTRTSVVGNVRENHLYHLQQGEYGADCLAFIKELNALLFVQISVQKKGHYAKIDTFINLTNSCYLKLTHDNIVPEKVIYMYLNPCLGDDSTCSFNKLALRATQTIQHKHKKIFRTKQWFYAQPLGTFYDKTVKLYEYCRDKLKPH